MTNSHSSTPHWRETAARWTVLALRLAVGGTFVFSGLAKAIDIWGVGYKIDDYLAAFGWSWAMPFAEMMAVALPLFEFLAGLMLVIPWRKRNIRELTREYLLKNVDVKSLGRR